MGALPGAGIMIAIAIVYIVVTTGVGVWSIKYTKDTQSFMTAKNLMGPTIIGILLMSEFIGTGSSLGTAQTAFEKGISAAWNVLTLGVGYLLYAFLMAPRFSALGEYTISGALSRKYGTATRLVVSVTMIYALTTVNVSMYTGGAATIAVLLGVPATVGVLICGAVAVLNVATGGMRGVGYSNLIHVAFKYLGLIIIGVVAWGATGGPSNMAAKLPATYFAWDGVGVTTIAAWTIGNIGAVFSTQYVIQTISGLDKPSDARKAALIAAVAIVPFALLASFAGVGSKIMFPSIKSVNAIPQFLTIMDPYWGGLVVAALVASTFVTVLACQIGATALFIKDFYTPLAKPGEAQKLWASRVVSIVFGLLPIPFALFMPGILSTIFFARALRTTVAVAAIAMFYLPHFSSGRGAALGIALAAVGASGWFFMNNPYGIDNIYVAVAIPAIVMVIDHLVSRARSNPVLGDA